MTTPEVITPDMCIARYIELRDAKAALVAAHDAAVAPLDDKMALLNAHLLAYCNEHKTEGLRTAGGTLARKVKVSWKITDRGAFLDHIRQSGNVELLESRVSGSGVDRYLIANPGSSVPGVASSSEYTLTITAPKK